jgi:uncharacterized membrane protein
MALPISGSISASAINYELNRSVSNIFSLNNSLERQLANKPSSGSISFSDFYGKSFFITLGPISSWSYSLSQFNVDQGPPYFKTWDESNRLWFPINRFPRLTVSNNGLFATLYATDDANNICRTHLIWSFLGKTYRLINESHVRRLDVKDFGASDNSYITTNTRNFTSASGFVYMRVSIGVTSTVHIGNENGILDLSQMTELINFNGNFSIKPDWSYVQNFHYNGQTSQTVYALTFTGS